MLYPTDPTLELACEYLSVSFYAPSVVRTYVCHLYMCSMQQRILARGSVC